MGRGVRLYGGPGARGASRVCAGARRVPVGAPGAPTPSRRAAAAPAVPVPDARLPHAVPVRREPETRAFAGTPAA
ncbi:hypothetical protein Skr01_05560 [Sphaerisporangium krabiense]|uniref:Uncharacterized protein n=1 Tax=Sphaerisporangium krabiense TaxID=763782 RepID=A0A7W9DS06_9ACTN|nr:hypothetical protein [Sphaerisporangium krabiense]MBB5628689.1 hypothetical protein [Sphaerisporangium krabiense]GII60471.1 hypothetical protein Skr01_05560 [Sphaerisporangium krabiense]